WPPLAQAMTKPSARPVVRPAAASSASNMVAGSWLLGSFGAHCTSGRSQNVTPPLLRSQSLISRRNLLFLRLNWTIAASLGWFRRSRARPDRTTVSLNPIARPKHEDDGVLRGDSPPQRSRGHKRRMDRTCDREARAADRADRWADTAV